MKQSSKFKSKPARQDDTPKQITEQPPHGKLYPDYFYRLSDGPKFFGYRLTVLAEKIATGEIPMPVSLSESGRAKGWFGRTIIAWQRDREEKAKQKPAFL